MKIGDYIYAWSGNQHALILRKIDWKGRVSLLFEDGTVGEAYVSQLSRVEELIDTDWYKKQYVEVNNDSR